MKKIKVLVKDSQKNTVSSADLTQEAKEAGSIDISGISKAGQYTVEFVSDFDRVDGLKNEQKKINEKEIKFEIEIKPVIKVENITNKYPGKGEEIAITYNITVDGEDYPIQDNSCIINTTAPSVVGDKSYEISKIRVGD